MEFKDLLEKHKEMQALAKKEEEAIEALQRKIAWHERKQRKIEESGSFWATVIYPLCEEICRRKNFKYYQIYGPFGMDAQFSLYFSNEGGETLGKTRIPITEVPTWSIELAWEKESESGLRYWTGERNGQYQEMSIGWLNGFDKVFKPLPANIDEIIELLEFDSRKEDE